MFLPRPEVLFTLILIIISQNIALAVPGEHSGRFIGLWLIDQPSHALYEATLYRFNASGSIEVLGQTPGDYNTGTICSTSTAASCAFGAEWYSKGPDTLFIILQCGALGRRVGTFVFPDSSHTNCSNPDIWCGNPVATAVQQDTVWRHCDFEWRWTKCIRGDYFCFRPFGSSAAGNGFGWKNRVASKEMEKTEFADLRGRTIAASQAFRGNHIVIRKTTCANGNLTVRAVFLSGPAARSSRP